MHKTYIKPWLVIYIPDLLTVLYHTGWHNDMCLPCVQEWLFYSHSRQISRQYLETDYGHFLSSPLSLTKLTLQSAQHHYITKLNQHDILSHAAQFISTLAISKHNNIPHHVPCDDSCCFTLSAILLNGRMFVNDEL
jgi:hypothetical protein